MRDYLLNSILSISPKGVVKENLLLDLKYNMSSQNMNTMKEISTSIPFIIRLFEML